MEEEACAFGLGVEVPESAPEVGWPWVATRAGANSLRREVRDLVKSERRKVLKDLEEVEENSN